MAWKYVQRNDETGAYRTTDQGGGGGGSSTLAGLDDVDLNNLQNGQIIKWDATNHKFVNANESGGNSGHNYSTTEQVVGTWIDGVPLYEKTVVKTNVTNGSEIKIIDYTDLSLDLKEVISFDGFYRLINSSYKVPLRNYDGTNYRTYAEWNGANQLQSYIKWGSATIENITVIFQYTKTTDYPSE